MPFTQKNLEAILAKNPSLAKANPHLSLPQPLPSKPPSKPPTRPTSSDPVPFRKEITEQKLFANWLKSLNLLPPAIWMNTHKRSTATAGSPDFIVPFAGLTFFIEFKLSGSSSDLSPPQQLFKNRLQSQLHSLHVVPSAQAAINLLLSSPLPLSKESF